VFAEVDWWIVEGSPAAQMSVCLRCHCPASSSNPATQQDLPHCHLLVTVLVAYVRTSAPVAEPGSAFGHVGPWLQITKHMPGFDT